MMIKDKETPKFTLVIAGLIFLAFLGFWTYKFGIFTPLKGTSTASISALWGQFIVSFLAVIIFDLILIILDIRKQKTKITKLISFWLIIATLIVTSAFAIRHYYPHKNKEPEKTNTSAPQKYQPLESTFITIGSYECLNSSNCWVDVPIQGFTTKGATIKMTDPLERDITIVNDTKIRDQVNMKLKLGVNYFTFQVTYPSGKVENKYVDTTMELNK